VGRSAYRETMRGDAIERTCGLLGQSLIRKLTIKYPCAGPPILAFLPAQEMATLFSYAGLWMIVDR